jgi:hypothetical protein
MMACKYGFELDALMTALPKGIVAHMPGAVRGIGVEKGRLTLIYTCGKNRSRSPRAYRPLIVSMRCCSIATRPAIQFSGPASLTLL